MSSFYFRLPVPVGKEKHQQIFSKGFSMNFLLIIWYVMGGFILLFFTANFLNMILMMRKDDPTDTVEKISERGLIPILVPSGSYYKEFLDGSTISLYRELGKQAVMAEDWNDFERLIRSGVLDSNTHVVLSSNLCCGLPFKSFYAFPLDGHPPWYIWIINRRWPMREQLTKHILIFQQVRKSF